MPQPAYVVLSSTGVVVRTHALDSGNNAGTPTTNAGDLEDLIKRGFLRIAEHPLDGGGMLIVVQKP
ncbi:MAG: hypothetical protein M3O61_06515 [Gemmatimonadota bacterium]|nr:hypothetical protein [Gemmatimonadota bacterium]